MTTKTAHRHDSIDGSSITQEQIAAYQKAMQEKEKQNLQVCLTRLQELASEMGYIIFAVPEFTQDGRVGATWGVRRER